MPDWLAPRVRDVPAAKLAYLQTHVDIDGLEPFAEHADATLRDALAQAGLAAEGPLMLHFHEAVGHDGAGRIEAAIAYAGHLEPSGELSLRLRPAGREAICPRRPRCKPIHRCCAYTTRSSAGWKARPALCCAGSPYEIHPHRRRRFDVAYPIAP